MDVAYKIAKSGTPVQMRVSTQPSLDQFALIHTTWGAAGAAWRCVPAQSGALLTRIITPGLDVVALRQTLLRLHSAAAEVLPDGHGHFHAATVPLWFGELQVCLQDYFGNRLAPREHDALVDVLARWWPRLDLSHLTPFQQRVLKIVAEIPRGECLTYGQVARQAGSPGAARAVGAALRANPFPILIPCHRVIGAGGKLTGFTAPGGLASKKRMLEMEHAGLPF